MENTRALIRAAEEADVRRLVHISIKNADPDSPLPYFRGKGLAEQAVSRSRLSWAIVRPTLIFGREDILINNIAWGLRRFPFFPVFGSGDYRVQPVFVEDVARIAVGAAYEGGDQVFDAVGPETYTFKELVRLIGASVGGRARLVHLAPGPAHALTRLAGILTHDVVLTRDEIDGLMAGLLVSRAPATGTTLLSEWLRENGGRLGRSYRSELKRHY